MENIFARTEMLLGNESMKRLANARVAVFGVGGVGGYVVEALARSGVGALDLIDNDTVSVSNINRQIIALHSTVGMYKVDVAAARARDIHPGIEVNAYRTFYLPETAEEFDFTRYDYVVDAIDTVTGKLMLVEQAYRAGTPIISSMGAGNKLDPTAFRVADIYETSVCPLAKVMRRELKKRGIPGLKVVYSTEEALAPKAMTGAVCEGAEKAFGESEEALGGGNQSVEVQPRRQKSTPGSVAFVPSVVGLIIAGEVVKDLSRG